MCFESAVEYDVEDGVGRKVAGAGQRRGREGLLHQGSVRNMGGDGVGRVNVFAERLANVWAVEDVVVDEDVVGELVAGRYGMRGWLERR